MPTPATIDDFLELVRKCNQVDSNRLDAYVQRRRKDDTLPPDPKKFASLLVREGLLTNFQAEQLLQGRYKGFNLGVYRIIERLGSGGTGTVYLAEHEVMKRRVALKVLPPSVSTDPAILERFRREAQAAAALDHPNIVRAYDFRQEGQLFVLVMEYVNGPSLEQVLQSGGPLSVPVACEYARHTAVGLDYAHSQGLIHRDVKPANLLVDPTGLIKILDMGLARFSPEGQESVTKKFDENMVMGTADYLAPEQAINLHNVDARADVYSLGATLYALLAGHPPFTEGTVTQKLLWHQMRDPTPIHEIRRDVPRDVARIVMRMMAKDPKARYQSCAKIADALAPFCASTPTPQGPARPGSNNGSASSSRVRTSSLSSTTINEKKKGNTSKHSKRNLAPPPRTHSRDDDSSSNVVFDDRPRRRRESDAPIPASGSGNLLSVLALSGAVLGFLVLIGGLLAYLMLAPGPKAQIISEDDGKSSSDKAIVTTSPLSRVVTASSNAGMVFRQEGAHAAELTSLAFAPDGARMATSSKDGMIKTWDVLNQRHVSTFTGHVGEINSVQFHPKGSFVLSAGSDSTARLWAVAAANHPNPFTHPKPRISCAVFGQTENDVVTSCEDNVIRLWHLPDSKLVREMPGHTGPISSLAFRKSPDNKRNELLSASHDHTLKLWDLAEGKELRALKGHSGICTAVSVSLDGKFAVSGSHDGSMRLWDLDTGNELHSFTENQGPVWTVAIAANGRRALSAGADHKVRLWDLQTRKLLQVFEGGFAREITCVAFSPEGRYVAACSLDRNFVVWSNLPQDD